MPSKWEQQRALVERLEKDVAELVAYATANTSTAAHRGVVVRVNARLDTYFTQCQDLLDSLNRLEEPYLYFRLIKTYRSLLGLFQQWD